MNCKIEDFIIIGRLWSQLMSYLFTFAPILALLAFLLYQNQHQSPYLLMAEPSVVFDQVVLFGGERSRPIFHLFELTHYSAITRLYYTAKLVLWDWSGCFFGQQVAAKVVSCRPFCAPLVFTQANSVFILPTINRDVVNRGLSGRSRMSKTNSSY